MARIIDICLDKTCFKQVLAKEVPKKVSRFLNATVLEMLLHLKEEASGIDGAQYSIPCGQPQYLKGIYFAFFSSHLIPLTNS